MENTDFPQNCHYYAFGSNPNDSDPDNPNWAYTPNVSGYHSLGANQDIQINDRVIYFVYQNGQRKVTHSGIVAEVEYGEAASIRSKLGIYGIYEHRPDDVPDQYGPPVEYVNVNGVMQPTRVYYRKN